MRYFVLATDYDGTLAEHSQVSEKTLSGLKRLRESGRKLILVTGRHLDDICNIFSQIDWFDCIVAENGAVLYFPATKEEQLLGDRPPEIFIEALQKRNVDIGVGRVIVSTWEPNETVVLEVIRDLGLELQVVFNKGAVMVLPSGINKASGLLAALTQMNLSPHNVVAIGDAENDHAFLNLCEISVAVENALPMLKEKADWITQKDHGDGVIEVIDQMIANDLKEIDIKLERNSIVLGIREDGTEINFQPQSSSILLAGMSGGGKSTLATGLLEQIVKKGYQFCIIDPEGDYESFERSITLGNSQQKPNNDSILELLANPNQNLIVNLLGVKLEQRPTFFAGLLRTLLEMRAKTGRPHWIIIDEVHHLLPTSWNPASFALPQILNGILMITVHPDHVAPSALSLVETVIAVGKAPQETLESFCQGVEYTLPEPTSPNLEAGQGLIWFFKKNANPFRFRIIPPQIERRRHMRNYAEGELGPDNSFYFRGAEAKLNLRSQNLITFTQLAEGVDDETWLYHLHQKDYSRWFRESIKDNDLAEEATQIEEASNLSAQESRDRMKVAIEKRYTLPA